MLKCISILFCVFLSCNVLNSDKKTIFSLEKSDYFNIKIKITENEINNFLLKIDNVSDDTLLISRFDLVNNKTIFRYITHDTLDFLYKSMMKASKIDSSSIPIGRSEIDYNKYFLFPRKNKELNFRFGKYFTSLIMVRVFLQRERIGYLFIINPKKSIDKGVIIYERKVITNFFEGV